MSAWLASYFLPIIPMKTFTKGFAAGASALALGIPLLAQVALAASGDGASAGDTVPSADRPVPSQPCTEAMAHLAAAHVDAFDEMNKERKAKMIAHRDALVAAAAIGDDSARQEALKAAHGSMKPGEDKPELPAAVQAAMDGVKAACGDTMAFKVGHGPKGGHGGPFMVKMKRFGRGAAEAAPVE